MSEAAPTPPAAPGRSPSEVDAMLRMSSGQWKIIESRIINAIDSEELEGERFPVKCELCELRHDANSVPVPTAPKAFEAPCLKYSNFGRVVGYLKDVFCLSVCETCEMELSPVLKHVNYNNPIVGLDWWDMVNDLIWIFKERLEGNKNEKSG